MSNPIIQQEKLITTGITFDQAQKRFVLTTNKTAYVFQLMDDGRLLHLYWGTRLPFLSDYPNATPDQAHASPHSLSHDLLNEFPTLWGIQEIEPCLRLLMPDGTRDLRLVYHAHTISPDGASLAIELKDQHYPVAVTLHYQLRAEFDILVRHVSLTNQGDQPIIIEEALSASVNLPTDQGDYRLTYLGGAWAAENQIKQVPITLGQKVLQSRQNYTGHLANPFVAIDLLQPDGSGATETSGSVWFGALHWSGNWKIVVEQTQGRERYTRLAAGLNDWDFNWQLEPNQTFETPQFSMGYTEDGFGQMSRNLHAYTRQHLLPQPFASQVRPVRYNSWEAVLFNVNEADQLALAQKAVLLGTEIFVVDDGWFGSRDSDNAGLGDWQVNPHKFPNGLGPLVAEVNRLGMAFGIWVEPEMVNPDSDLYRTHPEWVYHFPNREPVTSRQQLMLNLARQDVQAWMFGWLDQLLTDYNIQYVKWDFNRAISEAGWPEAPQAQQREIYVRHVQALYQIVDRLRQHHPTVLFEACASGGGRVDFGSLTHFDHVWTSDNTDPFDRLSIQQGFSLVYPAKAMFCEVTDSNWNGGTYSMKYRFHTAMAGSLSVGTNLNHWTAGQIEEAAGYIKTYKRIQATIQEGSLYRLTPFNEVGNVVLEYLGAEGGQVVVLAFRQAQHFWGGTRRYRLQGLEPGSVYELSGDLAEQEALQMSGQALMSYGIKPRFEGYLASSLIEINRVK